MVVHRQLANCNQPLQKLSIFALQYTTWIKGNFIFQQSKIKCTKLHVILHNSTTNHFLPREHNKFRKLQNTSLKWQMWRLFESLTLWGGWFRGRSLLSWFSGSSRRTISPPFIPSTLKFWSITALLRLIRGILARNYLTIDILVPWNKHMLKWWNHLWLDYGNINKSTLVKWRTHLHSPCFSHLCMNQVTPTELPAILHVMKGQILRQLTRS